MSGPVGVDVGDEGRASPGGDTASVARDGEEMGVVGRVSDTLAVPSPISVSVPCSRRLRFGERGSSSSLSYTRFWPRTLRTVDHKTRARSSRLQNTYHSTFESRPAQRACLGPDTTSAPYQDAS